MADLDISATIAHARPSVKRHLSRSHWAAILFAATLSGAAPLYAQVGNAAVGDLPRSFEGYGLRALPPRIPEGGGGKGMAYAGLALRQNPEGVVVLGVQPGPFGGDGLKSPSIWRGDLIVSMNGRSLDAAGYGRLVRSLAPGDRLQLTYRRSSHPDPGAAIPVGDPSGEAHSVEIVLDDAARWHGTIGRGPGRVLTPAENGEFEALILAQADELGLRRAAGGLDALLTHLATLQQNLLDPNSVTAAAQALQRPLALDRVESDLAAEVRRLAAPQPLEQTLLAVHRLILRTLGLPDLQSQPDLELALSSARRDHEDAVAGLLQGLRDDSEGANQHFAQHLELMRASPRLIPLAPALLPQVARRALELEQFARQATESPEPIPPELTERVRAAVEGPVLGARVVDGGLWVVGGRGSNRYDMALLAAVYDIGGDDVYSFSAPSRRPFQIVVDAAGDDLYEAGADLAGPAAGVFSVSVIDDRAGNDLYVSRHQGSIAAGIFGVGILIDEAGDDRYINDTAGAGWSQGVGFYGAGILIDRGGDDRYEAQVLAQGVGGPGGFGLLLDVSGDDSYFANGPHFPSSYGTPGVFAGSSQGFGLGIRGYAAGGLGALYDLGGDDRYSVGEFGQGTGYFQALGILHDGAGNDQYAGARYAQGSAAHQAAGVLIDDAGNDSYISGSAGQGAAWDESVALLVDRSGDDHYVADRIAQGSGAQQAVGMLIDLDGADTYSCSGACQGQGGDNTYHYDEDAVFSFSVLIDRGGKTDVYSQSRPGNGLLSTGDIDAERPALSDCCGVFLDE
jgi:hypothetical protein